MAWRSLRAFSIHGGVRTIALGGHPLQIAGDGRVISPVGEELHQLLSRSPAFVWESPPAAPADVPAPADVAAAPSGKGEDRTEAVTDPPPPPAESASSADADEDALRQLLTQLSADAPVAASLDSEEESVPKTRKKRSSSHGA